MTLLLDTSLWIDFTRARGPVALKQRIAPYVLVPAAHLAEPVRFEVLRAAQPEEARFLEAQFDTLPLLPTPMAAIALHHNAALVSYCADKVAQPPSCFSSGTSLAKATSPPGVLLISSAQSFPPQVP